jgi:hypothetical protein
MLWVSCVIRKTYTYKQCLKLYHTHMYTADVNDVYIVALYNVYFTGELPPHASECDWVKPRVRFQLIQRVQLVVYTGSHVIK